MKPICKAPGCGMPAMNEKYCSAAHAPYSGISNADPRVDLDLMEKRWQRYVEKAKSFVKDIKVARMGIAKAAIEATEFESNGYGKARIFTVERFSYDVGVKYKTLLEWICIYRNVASKLEPGADVEKNLEVMRRVRLQTTPETPSGQVQELIKKELSRNMDQQYFVQSLKRIGTLRHYIVNKADLRVIDAKELSSLEIICVEILEKIREYKTHHGKENPSALSGRNHANA